MKIVIIGEKGEIVKIVRKRFFTKRVITLFLLPSTNQIMAISNSIWKRKFTEPVHVVYDVETTLSRLLECHSVEELENSIESKKTESIKEINLFVRIENLFDEMFFMPPYIPY